MRKIFTLLAAMVVAIVANAQVLINYEHTAELPAGIQISGTTVMKNVKITTNTVGVDCIQFANGYTTSGELNGNCAELSTEGGFKAGDVVEIAGFFNNADDTKNSAFVIYVKDSSESGYSVLWTSEKLINGRLVDDEPRVDTYVLEQDAENLYIARNGNTGTNIYTLKVTRPEASNPSAYEVNITSDPENNYFSGDLSFNGPEVAAALGMDDAASLQALINAGGAVYLKVADGQSNAYTGNTNEFWMNLAGEPVGYGEAQWFVGLRYVMEEGEEDPANGVVDIYMGQMPDYFKNVYEPSTLTCTLYLVNGDKQVAFDVTLNVNAAKEPETIADPVKQLSGLTILKEYAGTLEFTTGKEYENKTLTIDLSDITEVLGVSETAISDNIEKVLLTAKVETNDVTGAAFTDELDFPENLAGGSWFGRYTIYDESTGVETQIVQNGPKNWGAGATFYLQNPKLADGEFTLNYGQFMNTMEAGAQDYAVLYIVNGDKAVQININVNVVAPEKHEAGEMVLVGESSVDIKAEIDNNYATKPFSIDMEAITAALGCEAADIEDVFAWAAENDISDNHTEGSGGFYFGEDGYIASWGSSSAFFVAKGDLANGSYTIGQMSGHFTGITEATTVSADLIFQYATNYYIVHVNYTVAPEEQKGEDFVYTLKATEVLEKQIIPNSVQYNGTEKTEIDLDYINSIIGTTDFKLYTDKYNEETAALEWSSNYTCTPAPGFWYGSTSYDNGAGQTVVDNAGWGSSASFGFTYASGTITWYEIPDARQVGDSYMANVYLVNEETGDYVKYIFSVSYVEELGAETETVGTEEIAYLVNDEIYDESEGIYVLPVDFSAAFDELGLDDETVQGATVIANKSNSVYASTSVEETIFFNEAGYSVNEDSEEIALSVTLAINDDNKLVIKVDDMDFFAEPNQTAVVRVGFESDAKRYLYVITLSNDAVVVGINSANTTASAKAIYTVSGAKVNTLQKGINIVKMSDGSVKKQYVK